MDEIAAHPHDAVVRLTELELTQIFDQVTKIVNGGSLAGALELGDSLVRYQQASGFAFAHLLYELNGIWAKDEDFVEYAAIRFGKAPETIRRNIEIWQWVMVEPKHSRKRLELLATKPFSGLWYLKQASKEGQLGPKEWQEIERAATKQDLRQIMLDVRGEYRRGKDALKLMLEEDGILKARRGNKAYVYVGRLNVEMEDPVVIEAIERIINSSGVFRR